MLSADHPTVKDNCQFVTNHMGQDSSRNHHWIGGRFLYSSHTIEVRADVIKACEHFTKVHTDMAVIVVTRDPDVEKESPVGSFNILTMLDDLCKCDHTSDTYHQFCERAGDGGSKFVKLCDCKVAVRCYEKGNYWGAMT